MFCKTATKILGLLCEYSIFQEEVKKPKFTLCLLVSLGAAGKPVVLSYQGTTLQYVVNITEYVSYIY